jgi:flagellar hook-associated protein 3 FlgL
VTERISPQMVANNTIANIDNDLTQLSTTQEQLSTGFQINSPSDDPFGAAETLTLTAAISNYSAYTANVNDGTSWTNTATGALQTVQSVAQNVRSMVVAAANGTLSQSDLNDDASSVLQDISSVKEAANAQYNGQYIFSGTATNEQPYQDSTDPGTDAFNTAANTNSINRLVAPATTVGVNANLYQVLGDGNGAAGAFTPADTAAGTPSSGGLLATMRQIYSDMQSGNQAGLESDLGSLDTNLGSLESVQAQVGATQNQLQFASTRITSFTTTDKEQVSDVYDTDYASATVNFSTEQAGYQAALQSSADIIQTSLLNFLNS